MSDNVDMNNERVELLEYLKDKCYSTDEEVTDEMVEAYKYCLQYNAWRAGKALRNLLDAHRRATFDVTENTRKYLEEIMK